MDEEWDWMKDQWANIWGTIGNEQISLCSGVWVSTIRLLITRSLEKNAKERPLMELRVFEGGLLTSNLPTTY